MRLRTAGSGERSFVLREHGLPVVHQARDLGIAGARRAVEQQPDLFLDLFDFVARQQRRRHHHH
ncbi:hypothetical protein CDQ91_20725 [Sphingopyxis witflariensis]|uniref:Uncharacterized protein n=1 Tax=Sphingopyxis witflariensis TaxID=173675 RepID=A0A246J7P3_9SPHN|nr:hypothetical protein CDQ91_20725 [Sphingopyxis witflariensis]